MGSPGKPGVSALRTVTTYVLLLVVGWVVILSAFLAWDIHMMKDAHLERARLQAALIIEDDAYYRNWLAAGAPSHALGAKSPASKTPHLIGRQVQEFRNGDEDSAQRRHLVGFDGPFCDAWEKSALEGFMRGEKEANSPFERGGVHYFRLMRPLYAQSSCLKCHKAFKPGKVCGAVVVGIPMVPLWAIQRRRIRQTILIHSVEGAFVLAFIAFLSFRLKDDLGKIRALKGILPICASCKNIRDASGDWKQMESYVRDHSEAIFSHALCTTCFKKNYPEYYKDEEAG